jgi:hypothetical protein
MLGGEMVRGIAIIRLAVAAVRRRRALRTQLSREIQAPIPPRETRDRCRRLEAATERIYRRPT